MLILVPALILHAVLNKSAHQMCLSLVILEKQSSQTFVKVTIAGYMKSGVSTEYRRSIDGVSTVYRRCTAQKEPQQCFYHLALGLSTRCRTTCTSTFRLHRGLRDRKQTQAVSGESEEGMMWWSRCEKQQLRPE